jgi:hypothetical protein
VAVGAAVAAVAAQDIADGTLESGFRGGMPLNGLNGLEDGLDGLEELDSPGGLEELYSPGGLGVLGGQGGPAGLDGPASLDGSNIQDDQDDLEGSHPWLAPDSWVRNLGKFHVVWLPPLDEAPAFGVLAVVRAYSSEPVRRDLRYT